MGRTHLRRNLETSDLKKAQEQRAAVLAEFDATLQRARRIRNGEINPFELDAIALRDAVPVRQVGNAAIPDPTLKAALLAEKLDTVRRTHGPEAAKRFHAIAAARGSTPLDKYLDEHRAEAQSNSRAFAMLSARLALAKRP